MESLPSSSPLLRTIVYVDGFNLYYGSLRKTQYKWLDLRTLFNRILGHAHDIVEIKYFTARINADDGNIDSPNRQNIYLRALQKHIPELSIYYGCYLTHPITAKLYKPEPSQSPYVRVLKTEEKGSDVNLALHILNDAWLNKCDCTVLVSNDSDIAQALRFITEDHGKKVGLIVPGDDKTRKVSNELKRYATFIHRISKSALESSLLPDKIKGSNLSKPDKW